MGITQDDLTALIAIPGEQNKDSRFVREGLSILYKNDAWKLYERSVNGIKSKAESSAQKKPITPTKLSTLRSWYVTRIERVDSNDSNKEKRISTLNFNRLVSNAIGNICRRPTFIDIIECQEDEFGNI